MGEKINIAKYPEGLDLLAKKLDLPFPEENIEARKAYVQNLVNYIINL